MTENYIDYLFDVRNYSTRTLRLKGRIGFVQSKLNYFRGTKGKWERKNFDLINFFDAKNTLFLKFLMKFS